MLPSADLRDVWTNHLRRIDNTVELGLGNKAQFQRGGLQRENVVHRVVSDLRRLVVTDDGRQRGHQHERAFNAFLDLLRIWFGARIRNFRKFTQPPVMTVIEWVTLKIISG